MKTYKHKGIIAGILLIVSTAFSVISTIIIYQYTYTPSPSSYIIMPSFFSIYWPQIIGWLILFVLAIGLMIDNITISRVAAVFLLAISLSSVILVLFNPMYGNRISYIIDFLYCLCIVLALFTYGKQASLFCYIAMSMLFVQVLSNTITTVRALNDTEFSIVLFWYPPSFLRAVLPETGTTAVLLNALFSLPTICYVFFLSKYLKGKPKAIKYASISPVDTISTVEKVSKLKSLLDKGIITQEEFDAKKKQILGQ